MDKLILAYHTIPDFRLIVNSVFSACLLGEWLFFTFGWRSRR